MFLMAIAGRPLWEVVGGGDKGGILVRAGQDTTSAPLGDRLSTGALVTERELAGDRLCYEMLAGTGPDSGWVSQKLPDKDLLVRVDMDRLWEVVGGGEKGGILVRQGQDTTSPALASRLPTGALVKQLSLAGDRLHYKCLSGEEPATGWVSVQAQGKELLLKLGKSGSPAAAAAPPPAAKVRATPPAYTLPAPPSRPTGPVKGRKMRVLGVHATPANSNVLKFQTSQVRKALGTDAEWFFADAPTPWEAKPGSTWPNDQERSEFEKRLAQGKPFTQWYHTASYGDSAQGTDQWQSVEPCCQYLAEYISKHAPIDVVVAFSQGSSMVAALTEQWRRKGCDAPWRLAVLFNGGNITDGSYQFKEPSPQPTVYVAGGDADPYYHFTLDSVKQMYTKLVVLEHADGHTFPMAPPRANEVYEQVAKEMRRHCGLSTASSAPAPKKAPAAAKAAAPAEAKGTVPVTAGSEEDFPPGMWTVDYIGNARGRCTSCTSCEYYMWNPAKLRPERGDDGDCTITEWFLNDYDSLNCQRPTCGCKFNEHKSLGQVNKPAGFYPGLSEEDTNSLLN